MKSILWHPYWKVCMTGVERLARLNLFLSVTRLKEAGSGWAGSLFPSLLRQAYYKLGNGPGEPVSWRPTMMTDGCTCTHFFQQKERWGEVLERGTMARLHERGCMSYWPTTYCICKFHWVNTWSWLSRAIPIESSRGGIYTLLYTVRDYIQLLYSGYNNQIAWFEW